MDPHALDGFTKESFEHLGRRHDVFRTGSGPAVIVIHEVPGITPLVAAFARKVAERGLTAVMPSLFGTPGAVASTRYEVSEVLKACVNTEFTKLALNKTSPITTYLRALAAHELERCGGPGVGAVGMCLTGGFALAMSVDPIMVAPVLSQPSLPLPLRDAQRRALGISDDDLSIVKTRVAKGLCVMGLRFTLDKTSPPERFARLRKELGDNFIGVEIDSSPSNPWGYPQGAHSVLTTHYSNEQNSPTRRALDDVLTFLAQRLGVDEAK
ncbi:MAG: dienelactone hydrolase [Acidobacteria bacterium]|nr:dienelactone hydrolase [Acidobacteriota bacterium]